MENYREIAKREATFYDSGPKQIENIDYQIKRIRGYDTPAYFYGDRLPRLKKLLSELLCDVRNLRVLICGTGGDPASFWFAMRGARVDAIDISVVAINKQKTIAKRMGLSINYYVMDAHCLQFEEDKYDIVYGNAVLHHLIIDSAASEMKRVLKPGGFVVFRDVLDGNRCLRCFRRLTPNARTPDEHPLTKRDFNVLNSHFKEIIVNSFVLIGTPYWFFERMMNNYVFPKFGFNIRIPTDIAIYHLFDIADNLMLKIFPPLKYKAWLCLIVGKNN